MEMNRIIQPTFENKDIFQAHKDDAKILIM